MKLPQLKGLHGDKAVIFKQGAGSGYERALELQVRFRACALGEAVFWENRTDNRGSRGRRNATVLYRFNPNREEENRLCLSFAETVIDRGRPGTGVL